MIIEIGCYFLVNWLVDRVVGYQTLAIPIENKASQVFVTVIGKMNNLQCLPKNQALQVCQEIRKDLEGIEKYLNINFIESIRMWNEAHNEDQIRINECNNFEKNLEDLEAKRDCLEREVKVCMSEIMIYQENIDAEKSKLSKRTMDWWQNSVCKIPESWVNWMEKDRYEWEILLKQERTSYRKKSFALNESKTAVDSMITSMAEKIENVSNNIYKSNLLDEHTKNIANRLIFVRTTKINLSEIEDKLSLLGR